MFRTRIHKDIVSEFLPPARTTKKQKVIVLCDGMPSIPRKQTLTTFLSRKGYWVFYPRYRGAWESGGEFLEKSPHRDILDILHELPTELEEIAFGRRFRLAPDQVFVIGGSFGGAAAILLSLDPRVKRVVANCPVVRLSAVDSAALGTLLPPRALVPTVFDPFPPTRSSITEIAASNSSTATAPARALLVAFGAHQLSLAIMSLVA